MNLNAFVERARQGQSTPMIYWLGHGGFSDGESPSPGPGRPIDPAAALAKLKTERPQVHADYVAGMAKAGIDLQSVPHLACDCSGFVTWALGVSRNGSVLPGGGWINTDAMYADATTGAKRLFVTIDRAVPGALLVHPRPGGADKSPGHVAIVVAADANGRATRMLHCAPENYLIVPADGRPRNAIAETDTRHFDANPTTRLLMWRAFA